jgi:hypothetical protein
MKEVKECNIAIIFFIRYNELWIKPYLLLNIL